MGTDSMYIDLAEKQLECCIRPEMKAEWERLLSKVCTDSFTADAFANFFRQKCCDKHKKHDNREPGLFKEEFSCTEIQCLCSETYCHYDVTTNNFKLICEALSKRVPEQGADGPLEKHRFLLGENKNNTSTNRGFRTNNHAVPTSEQIKKDILICIHKKFKRVIESTHPASHFVETTNPFSNILYLIDFILPNYL